MKKDFFCASEFVVIKNLVWFVPLGYRYLCCYDVEQKKILEQFLIPNNRKQVGLYESVVVFNKKLFFIPYVADYFMIFDLNTMKFEMIPVEPYETRGMGFYANCIYKEFIYFFPRTKEKFSHYHCMIGRINMETYEIKYRDLHEIYQNETEDEQLKVLFRRELFVSGDQVYLFNGKNGILRLKLSEKDNLVEDIELFGLNNQFTTICEIELKEFYLTDISGGVKYYNKDMHQLEVIENKISNFVSNKNDSWYSECFSYSISYRKKVFLFPSEANMVLQIDRNDMTVKEAFFSKEICTNRENFEYSFGQFSKPYRIKNKLYIWNIWSGYFYIIDLLFEEVKEIRIDAIMKQEELYNSYRDWCIENKVIKESELLYGSLDAVFLGFRMDKENMLKRKDIHTISDEMIGNKIWDRMKKE